MATEIWVNIGSGNGLLPDGTKPLPEPMLTDHKWQIIINDKYSHQPIGSQVRKNVNHM